MKLFIQEARKHKTFNLICIQFYFMDSRPATPQKTWRTKVTTSLCLGPFLFLHKLRNKPLRKYTTLSTGSQDKESFFEKHRTQKKRFSFSRSLRVFPSLIWCLATVLINCFHYYRGCLERRTVDSSKIQTNFLRAMQKLPEPSFSCGNSTCLKTPQCVMGMEG